MRKIVLILLLSSCFVSLFSCDKPIPGHAEARIPISGFEATEAEGFDAAYTNGESVVGMIRISFEAGFNQGIPETLSAKKFAEFYMKKTERDCEIKQIGIIPYYEYTDGEGDSQLYYLATFYRTKYAYFLILFATDDSLGEELRDEFLEMAESVYFVYDK